MIDLLYLARDHDLPPKWDGHHVEWTGWQNAPVTFICPPKKSEPCRMCGSTADTIHNRGYYRGLDRRTGRQWKRVVLALRCPDCRTDQAMDWHGDWWDLDPSDYTNDGSRVLR